MAPAHPHELGELVLAQGLLLEEARRLGRLLPAVHKDEHLVLARRVQHLRRATTPNQKTISGTFTPNRNHFVNYTLQLKTCNDFSGEVNARMCPPCCSRSHS